MASDHKKQHKKSAASKNQLRIIGGQWRSRKLPIPDVDGLRPSADRTRETLFNWLSGRISGTRCLDLFAGTGALGLEAISRGAEFSQFVELNKNAYRQLEQNLNLLKAEKSQASLDQSDAFSWLKQTNSVFDIAFIDPPFAKNLWDESAKALESNGILAEKALIYVEMPVSTLFQAPQNWQLIKSSRIGEVQAQLFERF